MEHYSEYVLAARPGVAYEGLAVAVQERHGVVVQADTRHLTVAFRSPQGEWGADITVIAAILDAGHGLSKLVVVGRDGRGETVDAGTEPSRFFADVELVVRSGAVGSVDGPLVSP